MSKLIFWGDWHHIIFGWIVCRLGDDGQTVLIFAGTGTTKFLVRICRGVNSYFGGTGTTIFLGGLFAEGGDGRTVFILAELAVQNFWWDYFEE